MISRDRAKELLSGALPQTQDEKDFVYNFNNQLSLDISDIQKKDEIHRKEILQANREYYALLMSILPESFLYKNPISEDEANEFQFTESAKIEKRILKIVFNPVLRKLNGLNPKLNTGPDGESSSFDKLGEKFLSKAYKDNFGVDIEALKQEYYSYFTEDVKEQISKIEEKYNTHIFYSFHITDYLSGWERFKQ